MPAVPVLAGLAVRGALLFAPTPASDGDTGPSAKPPGLQPADLFSRTYVGSAALAPDGRHALALETDGAGGGVELVALEWGLRGATRTVHELPADDWSGLVFDARGEVALFRRGASPNCELWGIESGGAPRRILSPGASSRIFDVFHAARGAAGGAGGDGRWLVLLEVDDPREALLQAVDVEHGELGEVVARFGPLSIRERVLAPDGSALALIATDAPQFRADGDALDLWLYDFAAGRARKVTNGGQQLAKPVFTPDSRAVVCALQDARGALAGARRDVAVLDLATGRATRLTSEIPSSIGNGVFGADEAMVFVDERTLLVPTQHGLADDVLEVVLPAAGEAAKWRWRTDGSGAWSRLSAAPAARRLLAVESGPARPDRIRLVEWPSFEQRVVEDPNDALVRRGLAPWRVVPFRGADELPLEGLLLEPREVAAPYPTLVVLHGGSDGRSTLRFNDNFAQAWASLGYAVFAPNLRGSEGYGATFRALNVGDSGGRELADLDAAADALVALGTSDPARLFVLGHSYGGYLAEMAAVRSRKFRAACAASGVSDWTSFYASSDLAALAVVGLGGTPDQQPELYRMRSPIRLLDDADGAGAPLLLVHGQRDRRVPVEQSERMFAALSRHERPCELLSLPGVGHVIRGRENVEKWLGAADRWFRKFGDATPEPAGQR
jgi:dipeptidyl aminopeptidase/acylaminoacyl peptidase